MGLEGLRRQVGWFTVAVAPTSSYSRKRFRRRLAVAFFVLLLTWGIFWLAARMLIVSAPLEHADVIVVLSGSSTFVERTYVAAQLYLAGTAEEIWLTNDNRQGGWLSSEQRNPFFYERARWELERMGVPRSKIRVLGSPVNSTQEEALAVREQVDSTNTRSVLLVTSAYHSRRALGTFERLLAGRAIVGVVSPAPGWQTPGPARWWLSPGGWRTVPNEYLKMVYYWLRF